MLRDRSNLRINLINGLCNRIRNCFIDPCSSRCLCIFNRTKFNRTCDFPNCVHLWRTKPNCNSFRFILCKFLNDFRCCQTEFMDCSNMPVISYVYFYFMYQKKCNTDKLVATRNDSVTNRNNYYLNLESHIAISHYILSLIYLILIELLISFMIFFLCDLFSIMNLKVNLILLILLSIRIYKLLFINDINHSTIYYEFILQLDVLNVKTLYYFKRYLYEIS